jgi:hypothetical protein
MAPRLPPRLPPQFTRNWQTSAFLPYALGKHGARCCGRSGEQSLTRSPTHLLSNVPHEMFELADRATLKSHLPPRFVYRHCNRVRKIQAAIAGHHRQRHALHQRNIRQDFSR